jgi:tRNA pseudouridine55 synthase
VEVLRDAGTLEAHIVTVEQVFAECRAFRMKPEWDKLLLNGNHIMEQDCIEISKEESTYVEPYDEGKNMMEFPDNWYRAYDSTGNFLGLYEKNGKKFTPVKMFL